MKPSSLFPSMVGCKFADSGVGCWVVYRVLRNIIPKQYQQSQQLQLPPGSIHTHGTYFAVYSARILTADEAAVSLLFLSTTRERQSYTINTIPGMYVCTICVIPGTYHVLSVIPGIY